MNIRFADEKLTLELTIKDLAYIVNVFTALQGHYRDRLEKQDDQSDLEEVYKTTKEYRDKYKTMLTEMVGEYLKRLKAQEAGNGHVHCEGLQGSGHESEA